MGICGFSECPSYREGGLCTDMNYDDQAEYCLGVAKVDIRLKKAIEDHYNEHHPDVRHHTCHTFTLAGGTMATICHQCGGLMYENLRYKEV